MNNNFDLEINYDKLNDFCNVNDFIIITDDILKKENMYKNFVYSTDDNFVGMRVYPKEMPIIMNKGVWGKLVETNNDLKKLGFCLMIYDAYRPIEIQKIFWENFYRTHGYYDETLVANPNKYGTHNIKINAVDMFIVNLDGTHVELPCEFDDFTGKANIHYNECSELAKYHRDLLINCCKKNGLIVNDDEWWHFYDERLNEYGMKFTYKDSDLVPINQEEVFALKR